MTKNSLEKLFRRHPMSQEDASHKNTYNTLTDMVLIIMHMEFSEDRIWR